MNSGIVTWTVRGSRSTPVTTSPAVVDRLGLDVAVEVEPSGVERRRSRGRATTWFTAADGPGDGDLVAA